MKKIAMMIAALGVATTALPATASAQQSNWVSINQRQANLDRRIDQGVRTGELNRAEASRLRAQYRDLAVLERQYRRSGNGLNLGERRDLDRRFDRLLQRIRVQKNDRQARW